VALSISLKLSLALSSSIGYVSRIFVTEGSKFIRNSKINSAHVNILVSESSKSIGQIANFLGANWGSPKGEDRERKM
jgi:hypothetical protein